jgi:hypothetical protein
VKGIRKLFNTPDPEGIEFIEDLAGPSSLLTAGFGIAMEVSTGELTLVYNGILSGLNTDLWVGNCFISSSTVTLPELNPPDPENIRSQKFIIPLFCG